ncbi:MAG: CPBP family intramembrane glutamic endopeptidase [Bacteroidota bacterium]
MNNFYDWKPEHVNAFVIIISVSIGFATYWFLALNGKIKSQFFKRYQDENGWVTYVCFQKVMGTLFMGVIPGTILISISDYTLADLGLRMGNYNESLIYIAVIGSLIFILNYFVSRNPFNLGMYPQMRIKVWNKDRILINSIAWVAYMFGYEFMYRGLLLVVCYDSFGFWPAVAINLSFYLATHIAKGLIETIGTIPYGLLLCFVTISTGSIAVAFVTHLILALSNDYFAVHHNPEMKFT